MHIVFNQKVFEMIDRDTFDLIKNKYGDVASWAIWSDEGQKVKSNVGDLSILDPDVNGDLLTQLNPNVVLVGLNISRGSIKTPLANFHDSRPEATDFKIRFAFKDGAYWGGYMTDIIKNFDQKDSSKVTSYLRKNKLVEEENVKIFRQELIDIGATNPTLIAFGRDVFDILNRNFKDEFKILKINHYAYRMSKEDYRAQVQSVLC